jgi:diadenosine tetraphosphate (Ap4A) HIT family hydrolase
MFQSQAAPAKMLFKSAFSKWHFVLFESENFVAIPSAGALVEGWLLILPKQFHISIGSIGWDKVQELREFINRVKKNIESLYGSVLVFEHGPAILSRPVGCSIDYAHLHIVPFEQGIFSLTKEMFPYIKWSPAEDFEKCMEYHRRQEDYLYLDDPFEGSFIASSQHIPSQLFRKVIAMKLNIAEMYDWRLYPEEHKIRAAVERISAANMVSSTCLKAT